MSTAKEILIHQWTSSGTITDHRVIEAFQHVPREDFMPEHLKQEAYEDNAFSIEYGQTISQPTTVVLMLQALELNGGEKILEVGTGSGYNAALLSVLVGPKGKVITTEIISNLARNAQEKLRPYRNVRVIPIDGSQGYLKEAPYDRIIITAACKKISSILKGQLKKNGILLAPVDADGAQHMRKLKKHGKSFTEEQLGIFYFVRMTGKNQ